MKNCAVLKKKKSNFIYKLSEGARIGLQFTDAKFILVMIGSRQIGSGQTRDGKSECQHSWNQQTKMDWNGGI